ncbi:MAG TPA: alpha/beta hydrolase-fold protein [Candidatus Limnocylindrales bacterium]|nr:alpha/beta hydrolase-fold protein [Candidatus Limnocylindrales bacterium]
MNLIRFVTLILLGGAIVAAQTPPGQESQSQFTAPQSPAAPVVSPEVPVDHRVTFRLRAPNAREVRVEIEGVGKSLAMRKDADGVWSATSEPLAPDYYGYSFVVDGVTMFDPSNSATIPNFLYRASELHVPPDSGESAPTHWEIADVPHGEVHHHFYRSKVVGDQRGYFVYTPPGYDPRGEQTYPVLYLLHGYSDDADAWTAVGRANVILDNLIARGKAKPMLIVMPLGYGAPEILLPSSGGFQGTDIRQRNFDRFRKALLTEVIPQVEAEYLVAKDRESRAIAGLSMGGSESLLTGMNTMNTFAWIGAFSSGGLTPDFDKEFPGLNARANAQLRLLWIACGTSDDLIKINRALRTWLTSKNIHHADIETPGEHSWLVWRRNLAEFVQLLFR